jgi:hypothetical protein
MNRREDFPGVREKKPFEAARLGEKVVSAGFI